MRNFFVRMCRGRAAAPVWGTPDQSLKDRLDYEIETISTMGYVNYYLIVDKDFIRYAKSVDIPVAGPRSSGAEVWRPTMGITNVDPIRYGLIFERFFESGTGEYA